MRCPFCAEEIQDEAIVCRFCGATCAAGAWSHPAHAAATQGPPRPARLPGHFTLRSAAVLLGLSAVSELSSVTSPVVLAGDVRSGALAALVHLAFVAAYAVMAAGLWRRAPWAPRAVYAGTALYTVDKLAYVLDRHGREAELARAVGGHGEVFSVIGKGTLLQLGVTTAALMVACWWGFALYVFLRRAWFTATPA